MTVRIDKEVLAATVVALDDLAADLPGLFTRASALDARIDVSGLNGAQEWAQDVSKDLQARIGVLEQIALANPTFGGVSMTSDQALAIAGQSMTVEDALVTVRASGTSAHAWDDTDPANLSEWFEQLEVAALEKLAGLEDSEQAEALVDAYNDVQGFIVAGGATVASLTSLVITGGSALASWVAQKKIAMPLLANLARSESTLGIANWLAGALNIADENYIRAKTSFTYPGRFVANTTQKYLMTAATKVETFDAWIARLSTGRKTFAAVEGATPELTAVAKFLQSERGTALTGRVSTFLNANSTGALMTRLAGWGNTIVGRPWTNPVTGVTFGRGAGNLLTMARTSGVTTMARSAGALRVLGVAGSGLATVDGVVGLVNNREENAQLWSEGGTEGKAHVIGEYAETAFNASMTAAMIAPNPVTIGLVAVTGVVWAGAEVVEHWDDIEAAAEKTVEWAGDRAEDATEWAGDRLDDIKESDLNPMNWF